MIAVSVTEIKNDRVWLKSTADFNCFADQISYGFRIGNTLTGRERLGLSPKEQPPRELSGKWTGWGATRRREALSGPPKEQAHARVNLSGTVDGGGVYGRRVP